MLTIAKTASLFSCVQWPIREVSVLVSRIRNLPETEKKEKERWLANLCTRLSLRSFCSLLCSHVPVLDLQTSLKSDGFCEGCGGLVS